MTASDSPGPSRGDGGHGREPVAGASCSSRQQSHGLYARFAAHVCCVCGVFVRLIMGEIMYRLSECHKLEKCFMRVCSSGLASAVRICRG
jgi:hypothetical protein